MPLMTGDKSLPRLQTIQMLRAVAAIMVTIAHASEEAKYFFHIDPWIRTEPLGKGVDLFFVISGFIIYYASRHLFGSWGGVLTFMKNRVIRVVPLYYIVTTLMVVTLVVFPSGLKDTKYDLMQIITSYLFIPYERYDGRIAPALSLGWTLNYEMFFYAIFALCMWMEKRKAVLLIATSIIGLAAIGFITQGVTSAPLRFWTYNIILEFVMGIGIALLYEKYGKSNATRPVMSWLMLGVGFVALYALNFPESSHGLPRCVAAGIPAALIVAAAVLFLPETVERAVPRWGSLLGDSSYSLYLTHRFAQRPIQIALRQAGLPAEIAGWVYVLVAIPIAVGFGIVVFRYVEQPLMLWFKGSKPVALKAAGRQGLS